MSPRKLLMDAKFANIISLRSASRILRASGLTETITAGKPLMNKKQMRQRISFCKYYRQMAASAWNNVIFTDDMGIELYGSRRAYVSETLACVFTMSKYARLLN